MMNTPSVQYDADALQQDVSDQLSWVRLTTLPELGIIKQLALLKAFGLPEAVFAANWLQLASIVGEAHASQITTPISDKQQALLETTHTWLSQPNHHLLTIADAHYPQSLLALHDPPLVLYCKGQLACLEQPQIALVGSRHATPAGLQNAYAFAQHLSQQGWGITSGLALGIDAAAHEGGLQGDGKTIAVIGTGIDRIYPAKNKALAHRIANEGLIVSEFALGIAPAAYNFPRRNRIIAGLSVGTLVVEAALSSGSLITAKLATELGREVFAIPGSIHSPVAKGCHALIKQGAKLVESGQDVVDELRNTPQPTVQSKAQKISTSPSVLRQRSKQAVLPVQPVQQRLPDHPLCQLMGFEPCSFDALVERSELSAQVVSSELLTLELMGCVQKLAGHHYQVIPAAS
jgi:DNA processing protein